jgi:uncharacterized protein
MTTRIRAVLVTLVAAILWIAAPALAAPTFPPLTGRVVDNAHVLDESTKAQLTAKLADLEERTTRQLVVVTLPSLQGYEIEDYGYQLGRAWGIGQKKDNNGILFIIAPNEKATRIEVGYGLEGIMTDALSSVILQSAVLPKFRSGDMQGGIVAGTDEIVKQLLLDAPAAKARVAAAEKRENGIHINPVLILFILFFVFSIFGRIFRGVRGSGLAGSRSGSSLWWLPLILMSGSGRDRHDDWGGGWGGGGGGWGGGGGGSFGGGGASGRW